MRGSSGIFARSTSAICAWSCGFAGPWCWFISRRQFGLLYVLLPRMGTELFPDANAPLLRVRLRAPAGTRIEETERIVLRALNVIQKDAGKDNVQITSDFMGVVPSSYPVDLIHLFTSGPQEAIIQVAVKPDTPRGETLRERIREDLHGSCRLPGFF
jgi:multidrug efflux pump subunit AcrB